MSEEKKTSDVEVFEFPEKEAQSDHYELLLLIVGDFTEEQANTIYGEAKELIAAADGTVTAENLMGRRNLAYRVNNVYTGTYFAVEFDLDKSKVAALSEKLRIRKDVARFMISKKEVLTQEEKDAYEGMREQLMNEGKAQKQKEQEEAEKKRKPRKKEEPKREEKKEEPKAPKEEDVKKGIDKLLSDDVEV
jgi:small subunit ribosomal protein S6